VGKIASSIIEVTVFFVHGEHNLKFGELCPYLALIFAKSFLYNIFQILQLPKLGNVFELLHQPLLKMHQRSFRISEAGSCNKRLVICML
jgi:hypothetical protein